MKSKILFSFATITFIFIAVANMTLLSNNNLLSETNLSFLIKNAYAEGEDEEKNNGNAYYLCSYYSEDEECWIMCEEDANHCDNPGDDCEGKIMCYEFCMGD